MAHEKQLGEPRGIVMSRFNLRIAELVQALKPGEVVEVLSGAGSFVQASNQNQNQNQNGSKRLSQLAEIAG